MAQKIVETIGFVIYLMLMIGMSYYLLNHSNGWLHMKLMGLTGIVIGMGQGAEMLTRIFCLMTGGIVNNLKLIGTGRKWMWISLFVVGIMLYEVMKGRTKRRSNPGLDRLLYGIAFIGIILSFFRFNQWDVLFPPKGIGFVRLVFLILLYGLLAIIFYGEGMYQRDSLLMRQAGGLIVIILVSLIITFWGGSVVVYNGWQILRMLSLMIILWLPFYELRHDNLLSRF